MSQPDLTQKDIENIIQIIKAASDVSDFSLKYGKTEIHISRQPIAQSRSLSSTAPSVVEKNVREAPAAAEPAGATAAISASPTAKAPTRSASEFTVDAPMVGTFYRAPSPGEAPFVEVGQEVAGDAILCIIEVMKLMNSISAKRKGRIREILVNDGEPVEFGQALMVIEAID